MRGPPRKARKGNEMKGKERKKHFILQNFLIVMVLFVSVFLLLQSVPSFTLKYFCSFYRL